MALAGYPTDDVRDMINSLPLLQNLGYDNIEIKIWIVIQTLKLKKSELIHPSALVVDPCHSLMQQGLTYERIIHILKELKEKEIIIINPSTDNSDFTYRLTGNTLLNLNKLLDMQAQKLLHKNENEIFSLLDECNYDKQRFHPKLLSNLHTTIDTARDSLIWLNNNNAISYFHLITRFFQ